METLKTEIVTRRQFFKKAVKATLPIIGLFAFGNISLLSACSKDEEEDGSSSPSLPNGCYSGCTRVCSNDCSGECKGDCEAHCASGCSDACSQACTNSCKVTCRSCSGTCEGGCYYGCRSAYRY